MGSVRTGASSSTGDEGTSIEQREDKAYVVTYHRAGKTYTKVIPRPLVHSKVCEWRVHVDGPRARTFFRDGNRRPVEQTWYLTQGDNHAGAGGCLIMAAMLFLSLLALLAA